jgi:hypothetical protein
MSAKAHRSEVPQILGAVSKHRCFNMATGEVMRYAQAARDFRCD